MIDENRMRVLTVAVRGDGACFHLDKTPLRQLKRMISQSFDGGSKKWRIIVKQLLKHKKACKVRLIIGFKNDQPIVEELIFRPKEKQ